MSDHGYGPHSNDADCTLLYTQAQMDAMVARAISAERERCSKVAQDEKVDADATGDDGDRAYNCACDHIAIRITEGM